MFRIKTAKQLYDSARCADYYRRNLGRIRRERREKEIALWKQQQHAAGPPPSLEKMRQFALARIYNWVP